MFLELSDKQQRFLRAELDAVYQDEAVDFNAGSKEVQNEFRAMGSMPFL